MTRENKFLRKNLDPAQGADMNERLGILILVSKISYRLEEKTERLAVDIFVDLFQYEYLMLCL